MTYPKGVGNKTGSFGFLGYPIPLLGGEFSKQDSYVSKGGPLGGVSVLELFVQRIDKYI